MTNSDCSLELLFWCINISSILNHSLAIASVPLMYHPVQLSVTVTQELPPLLTNESYQCQFADRERLRMITVDAEEVTPNTAYQCNITDRRIPTFTGVQLGKMIYTCNCVTATYQIANIQQNCPLHYSCWWYVHSVSIYMKSQWTILPMCVAVVFGSFHVRSTQKCYNCHRNLVLVPLLSLKRIFRFQQIFP